MQCRTPNCESQTDREFCEQCRVQFGVKSLRIMVDLQKNPREILISVAKDLGDATAQNVAEYLGISLPTLYAWVQRYFDMQYHQFYRKYVCAGKTCIVVDFQDAEYAWRYTMTDRIHAVPRGCMCFINNSKTLLMTTLPAEDGLNHALSAEVVLDKTTGIHHLKYPLRLPIYPGGSDD